MFQKGILTCIFLKISRNLENWLSNLFFWNRWGKGNGGVMIGGLFEKVMEFDFGATFGGSSSTSTSLSLTSRGLDDSTSFPLLSMIALHWSLGFCSISLGNFPSDWFLIALASWLTCISWDFMEAFILVQWVSMLSSWASSLLNLPLVSTMKVLKRSSRDGFCSTIGCWNLGGGCRAFLGLK